MMLEPSQWEAEVRLDCLRLALDRAVDDQSATESLDVAKRYAAFVLGTASTDARDA